MINNRTDTFLAVLCPDVVRSLFPLNYTYNKLQEAFVSQMQMQQEEVIKLLPT